VTKGLEIYDLLLDVTGDNKAVVEDFLVGLTWTYCRSEATGLCMTSELRDRSFDWPGSIKDQSIGKLASLITDWHAMKSSMAMAAINSVVNTNLPDNSNILSPESNSANLAVLNHFLPHIINKQSVVIGRYPGLEALQKEHSLQVVEINPGPNDLPAQAVEYVLPNAEWVFLTGTSIANKTFPRLMELSKNATVVLMGPSVPWLEELSEFGVDFLAGVTVQDEQRLRQVIAEGGGVNIFNDSVRYFVADLGQKTLTHTKEKIAAVVKKRDLLKEEMSVWYKDTNNGSFPKATELIALDEELSFLDSKYKQMWDVRNL